VACDNIAGGEAIAEHLIKLGHKRLAYVAGRPDASTTVDRWRGFAGRCARHGVPEPIREEGGGFSYQAGYAAAQRLLSRTPRPDAIFGANDIVALGVIDAARREFGLTIPDDLSVVGFDDIAMASWPAYSLTTVRQPVQKMIQSTVDTVRRLVKRPTERRKLVKFAGELIERNTVRKRR
jgi:DNA-binding LacI/PurR family transcriptional regulator